MVRRLAELPRLGERTDHGPFGGGARGETDYRDHWNVPGGIMEAGEPPHLCCAREVAEELSLELAVGRLLVVDWVPPTEQRKAWFGFLFDGGVLEDPSRILLQSEELEEFAFATRSDLRQRLTTNTADRVEAALLARESGGVAYLYDGVTVHHASSAPPRVV
ncbi:NUDIX domain-containing protein [Actinoplanes sp. NPDC049668]|uniref:NUDIX hydrolase n=1 Tax=unclassified Actinoplanes TaxID=2626549 RepID=UPI0033B2D6BC